MKLYKLLKAGEFDRFINKNSGFILLLIVLFGVLLRLYFFVGPISSDAMVHVKHAYQIATGTFDISHPLWLQTFRHTINVPAAVAYFFFGTNPWGLGLVTLLYSIGSLILVYFIAKMVFDAKVGLLSAFFYSFFPLDVIYSTQLLADAAVPFYSALSVYFFLRPKYLKTKFTKLCYFMSGIAFGLGYISKITVLLLGFFFVCHQVLAFIKKERKFLDIFITFLFFSLGFGLVAGIESAYYAVNTGDPLFALHFGNLDDTDYRLDQRYFPGSNMPNAFFLPQYIIMNKLSFADFGFFYHFIFTAIILIFIFDRKKPNDLLLWFLTVFLYFELGTTSLIHYSFIHKIARYFSLFTVPGVIILSYLFFRINAFKRNDARLSIKTYLVLSGVLICCFGFSRYRYGLPFGFVLFVIFTSILLFSFLFFKNTLGGDKFIICLSVCFFVFFLCLTSICAIREVHSWTKEYDFFVKCKPVAEYVQNLQKKDIYAFTGSWDCLEYFMSFNSSISNMYNLSGVEFVSDSYLVLDRQVIKNAFSLDDGAINAVISKNWTLIHNFTEPEIQNNNESIELYYIP
jgi:4-amino-4-deoxy-L-arabinose transferase-like glycosyltransferase